MTIQIRRILMGAALAAGAFSFTACEVDQTEEGEAPEVTVDEGRLPAYDVDTAEVDVETERREVEVPTVDVRGPGEGEG